VKSRYFKLGVLTLLTIAAIVATMLVLGLGVARPRRVVYHTYFDESVEGLTTGATVSYRGVAIGTVDSIDLAPDQRFVHVAFGVDEKKARALLSNASPDLRAELSMQGATGVKHVNIDFDAAHPAPSLAFAPSAPYIPSSPSLIQNLTDNFASILQALTPMIDSTTKAVHRIDDMLASFDQENVPQRVTEVLRGAQASIDQLHSVLDQVNRSKLPDKTAAAIEHLDATIGAMHDVLASLGRKGGLVDSANGTARGLGRATDDFTHTLRDLDEAAQAVRDLAQTLERRPDLLLKGRPKEKP
jgi:ABC-type transporter Mla subunit MlaD